VTDEHVRLFVALELPVEVRATLVDWRRSTLESVSALRAVPPESLHVTLCFLGWRSAGDVPAVSEACATVSTLAAPSLTIEQALWLPRRRPRVLAVSLDDLESRLGRVQSELSRRLAEARLYEPEHRPFLAHVTVARVRKAARVRADELPDTPKVRFDATTVTLFRSRLERGGARYEALVRFSLRV
jgi:2'-5' RNA ligase